MAFYGGGGGNGIHGGGTSNALVKYESQYGIGDSRITDDGTDIRIDSGAGSLVAGDIDFVGNGCNLALDDANNLITIQSDGNGNIQQLSLNGGDNTASLEVAGSTFLRVRGAQGDVVIQAATLQGVNDGEVDLGSDDAGFKQLFIDATVTPSGTTGNQTINKSAGAVNFGIGASSLTVACDKCSTNSIVIATVGSQDLTLKSVQVQANSGQIVLYGNAGATAETRVNFWVLNR